MQKKSSLYLNTGVLWLTLPLAASAMENAQQADSFVDSIGVGIHLSYSSLQPTYLALVGAPTNNLELIAYQPTQGAVRASDWNDTTNEIDIGPIITTGSPTGTVTISTSAYPALQQAILEAYAN
jgi:hypothetical protein